VANTQNRNLTTPGSISKPGRVRLTSTTITPRSNPSPSTKSQAELKSASDSETIEDLTSSKVLNILMPKTVELNDDVTTALTVRIEPSFNEEFQYIFLRRRSGEIELIKKRSVSGNTYYKITGLEQQGVVLPAPEMAKLINVVETRMSVSAVQFKELT